MLVGMLAQLMLPLLAKATSVLQPEVSPEVAFVQQVELTLTEEARPEPTHTPHRMQEPFQRERRIVFSS